ncbi:MFS transporter [Neobacillus novalis]|uniref:MFS transporter n=1 Tax=Neobacillus novalis TaxID=220687 RepID=A0AA95MKU4_9BACI|nr:MFS transporter [Neobacillus novalis]WHY85774.1 MFS transporter [Neobacillus novalis]
MTNETLYVENGISRKKMARRALVGSTFGTIIEFYDFFLYATASAVVFPKLFFPNSDPFIATMLSFATLATGFLARPIGAAIFGHFGDRIGRKKALIYTLWLMGISSTVMGLLPSFSTVGIWAPIMLIILRILQGIGVGGEWAGSILLSMEWGDRKKKGFAASVPNAGVGAGMLLSSATVGLCISLTGDTFYVWGWRIPFICSLLLLIVGVMIRTKISETPEFKRVTDGDQIAKAPILEVFKLYPKQVLYVGMVKFSQHVPNAIFATFMITYVTNNFHIGSGYMVNVIAIGSMQSMFTISLFGYLSDKVGIKRMYIVGIIAALIWAFPYIGLINTGKPILILLATIIIFFLHDIQAGSQPALVAQAFPARLRYSGVSLGYQLGAVFSGGIAPMVCAYLIHTTGTLYSVAVYIVLSLVIGFVGTILLKNYSGTESSTIEKENILEPMGSNVNA